MSHKGKIVIGTRGSELALVQARIIEAALQRIDASLAVELRIVKTEGDTNLDPIPLDTVGKGWFTKEIEKELIEGNIDLAAHSLKDLPEELPEGLHIQAYLDREDPRDVLISKSGAPLATLPVGSVVGTDSLRRRAQLLALRPDIRVESIRGNILTRIEKLDSGAYDAIAIAAAGVIRLGKEERITEYFPVDVLTPAPGQGILAVETRIDDQATNALIEALNDPLAVDAARAERSFSTTFGGGCKTPVGAYAELADDTLTLYGMVADSDDKIYRDTIRGSRTEAVTLGQTLALRLHAKTGNPALVLTGEAEATARLRGQVLAEHEGVAVTCVPTVTFTPRTLSDDEYATLQNVASFDYLFFSSARAVRYFKAALGFHGILKEDGKLPPAVVVGPVTARACREAGIDVVSMPSTYTAANMVAEFTKLKGSKILFPRSTIAPEDTLTSINNAGAKVTKLSLYETRFRTEGLSQVEREALQHNSYILFLSPSSIRSFVKLLDTDTLQSVTGKVQALCIGPRTERIAAEHGFATVTADVHTTEGALQKLKTML